MNSQSSVDVPKRRTGVSLTAHWPRTVLSWLSRFGWSGIVLLLALLLVGRSAPTALEWRSQAIGAIVGQWSFDLVQWEVQAIAEKLTNAARYPIDALTSAEQVALVETYIESAHRLGWLEGEISRLFSLDSDEASAQVEALQLELAELRAAQQARRPLVETIIQQQVSQELAAVGFGIGQTPFPPVWFTFVEPPKKLVVSPRQRIATVYSQMLSEEIDPTEAEVHEQAIRAATDLSAYITDIGGLGAFPTMVVDRSTLPWIFSTVAHEWVHNYLTLFPLGLRYLNSSELMTINETIADIVGDEIGERVVRRYYPAYIPADPPPAPTAADGGEVLPEEYLPLPFDFRSEMRETRLHVDALLAAGLVNTAERYMEMRRRYFVANGYSLRVLNQAYFAFHGSYGTSAASTSPIGPKLAELRELTGDLPSFLQTVRWFTSAADVDRALLTLRAAQ